jgi:hypothetical protein
MVLYKSNGVAYVFPGLISVHFARLYDVRRTREFITTCCYPQLYVLKGTTVIVPDTKRDAKADCHNKCSLFVQKMISGNLPCFC